MNLDHYILELLQEAAGQQVNLDPASVAVCLKKWNEELASGAAPGITATQLSKEQVEGAVRNFLVHIVNKNQFQFGFFMPGVYTFGYKALINQRSGKPNLFQNAGLQVSSDILNVRFTNLERILLTNTKVQADLNKAIEENEPQFSIGRFAGRDKDGKVYTVINSKGKAVPDPTKEVDLFEKTAKGAKAYADAKQKIETLTPYINALNDVKNYSLEEIKFILDQYNTDTIETQAGQLARRPEFQVLPWDTEKGEISKSEFDAGLNLVFTSPDGFTKIYAITDQSDAIKAGYFQMNVKKRYEELTQKRIISSNGEYYGNQWCVTMARKNNSFYSGYRQHASYTDNKDYTFYLVVNNHLDFYSMSDEEIQEKPEQWRTLKNLKYYINMFCIQPTNHQGYRDSEVRVSPLNNPGEPHESWSHIEKVFPGIGGAKDILISRKFDDDEMIGGEESVGYNEDSSSSRFIGAQSQSVKRTYIAGNEYNRGTIANPEVWRSLDVTSKKSYFSAADDRNYIDLYKSAALFNEIKSDPQTYKDMVFYVTQVHNIPDGMEKIKKNILKSEFEVDRPYRVSEKNKNVMLLQKRNGNVYSLYDVDKMEPYVSKDGIEYNGDYMRDKTMMITKERTGGEAKDTSFTAERYNTIRGASADDTFWTIYKIGGQGSYILTDNMFERLLNDGTINQVERDVNGRTNVRTVIDDPEELRRQQDIDEIIKGLK
jgi:hypothetical protein